MLLRGTYSSCRPGLIPAARASFPQPRTRPRRGLRVGTCERPGRWRGPGSESGCDSGEMQPRSKGVRQVSFGGTGPGGRRRRGVPCTSPPGCCRGSPPGRSGRDRSGRSPLLPERSRRRRPEALQAARAAARPRAAAAARSDTGPRPGGPVRARRGPAPLLPVLQPHQPQRDYVGHVQLRGPRAGGDAAEHAALLPDTQLFKLHGAGSTWWRGGPAPAPAPGPAPAAPARCCRRRAQPTAPLRPGIPVARRAPPALIYIRGGDTAAPARSAASPGPASPTFHSARRPAGRTRPRGCLPAG